jgi:hypothetical protein
VGWGGVAQEQLDEAIRQLDNVDTSTCEEKATAALALGEVARATRHRFGAFVDNALRILHAAAVAFQPSIRRAAFPAMAACIQASVAAYSQPIRSGRQSTASLHAVTESHADAVIVTCILAFEDDDDAETVARACDCLGSVAYDVGWCFMHGYLARSATLRLHSTTCCSSGTELPA